MLRVIDNKTTTKTKSKRNTYLVLLFMSLSLFFVVGCQKDTVTTGYVPGNYLSASTFIDFSISQLNIIPNNPNATLKVPTYITKIKENYFIVDCYNNQVIYNDNLTDPLYEWLVMTSDVSRPHSLASDGTVYLIDDTENHRILILEEGINENGTPCFVPTQEFTGIGNRPHYIVYDEATDTFYAWSSQSGEMFLFRRPKEENRVYLTEVRSMPSLANAYVRSFTIIGNRIYFVSGNSSITEADLSTFQVKKEYPVPDSLCGMIQITKIEDYYYITNSTDITGNQDFATIIRTKKLEDLIKGKYEDIYHHFIGGGTPYYISFFDNAWYLTEHRIPGHGIFHFRVIDNQISDVETIY